MTEEQQGSISITHARMNEQQSSINITPPSRLQIDVTASSTQDTTWKEWIDSLEMYFIAANITETKRKKAILLYTGGEELRKIHKTLNDTEETYEHTKEVLQAHFKLTRNITYERHKFRSIVQNVGDTSLVFITRLRESTQKCDFDKYSPEEAMIDQFIEKCAAPKLRRYLLKESKKLTLDSVIQTATHYEQSVIQAKVMETSNDTSNINTMVEEKTDEHIHQVQFNQRKEVHKSDDIMHTYIHKHKILYLPLP